MKISVIIPTYNEKEFLEACLNSLADQSLKNFEVVVVDDGSTDNSFEILSKLKIANYKLQILKSNHLGAGAARNLGAKSAKGEILVFVDADMTFDGNFLKKLTEPIRAGRERGTFSKDEYVKNWENVWARCWNIQENWEERKRHPRGYPNTQHVFRAILKSEFDKVGGFTPGGYDDDWSLGRKLGYMAAAAKGAVFYHRNPSNLIEVFKQSMWVATRTYKLGIIGVFVNLFRSSIPISLLTGFYKGLLKNEPRFIIFKVLYDFGIFIGILRFLILNKKSK